MVGLTHYLVLSSIVFTVGLFAIVTRRNSIAILMGIELILNAANLNLVAFSRFGSGNLDGHLFALFIIVLAACEAAVILAIVLSIYRIYKSVDIDKLTNLKE